MARRALLFLAADLALPGTLSTCLSSSDPDNRRKTFPAARGHAGAEGTSFQVHLAAAGCWLVDKAGAAGQEVCVVGEVIPWPYDAGDGVAGG